MSRIELLRSRRGKALADVCLCFRNCNSKVPSMFGRSSATFDRLLEKATSQLLLEPDWTSIMMICDSIRSGETNPKYAVTAIKKKFYHSNPHVALYALQVIIETLHLSSLL